RAARGNRIPIRRTEAVSLFVDVVDRRRHFGAVMRRVFLMFALLIAGAAAGSATLAAQSKSTARLTAADYTEIQQLYARYNTAIDSGDGAAWAATFVPDGVFNTNTIGHDALVQFVLDWRQNRNGANLRHWNTNIVIIPTKE